MPQNELQKSRGGFSSSSSSGSGGPSRTYLDNDVVEGVRRAVAIYRVRQAFMNQGAFFDVRLS